MSESRLLSIGDFAGICQLSVKTLRHYHAIGLLVPALVDERTGYRSYRFDQVAVAVDIAQLRALDVPLPEIAAALADGGKQRAAILEAHRDRLRQDLSTTVDRLAHLERILGREPAMEHEIREQFIAAQRVASKKVSAPNTPESNQSVMIAAFGDVSAAIGAAGASESDVPGSPVVVIHYGDEERFEQEVCIPIADHIAPVGDGIVVRELEAVRAAVARHVGNRVDGDDIRELMGWASDRGHEVHLPVRLVVVEAPGYLGDGDDYVSELVVPFHEVS